MVAEKRSGVGMKVIMTAAILFVVAGAASATTYFVATNGNDTTGDGSSGNPWRTIVYGCGQMGGGDTLIVRAGTYAEDINNIVPSGTAQAWTTVKAETVGAASIQKIRIKYPTISHYIVIDGFDVVGTTGAGVFDDPSNWGTVDRIRIQNCEVSGTVQSGVQTNADYTEIVYCSIHNCGELDLDHGIYTGHNYNVIKGCILYSNSGFGVQTNSSSQCSYNIVRNNLVYSNGTVGGGGIVLMVGTDQRAYNNIAWNNNACGIQLMTGTDDKLYNNTIYGNTYYGISLCAWGDINNAIIRNNILYNNQRGIYAADTQVNAVYTATIENNIVYGNSMGDYVNDGGQTTYNLTFTNFWHTNPGLSANPPNLPSQPENLIPASGSVAIDNGVNLSGYVDDDYAGNSRPVDGDGQNGAEYDLGAYEYGCTPATTTTAATTTTTTSTTTTTLGLGTTIIAAIGVIA